MHGFVVAGGWAGAVMPKLLAVQKYDVTDGRTDRHGKFLSRVSMTKIKINQVLLFPKEPHCA